MMKRTAGRRLVLPLLFLLAADIGMAGSGRNEAAAAEAASPAAVAVGATFSLALLSDGTVRAWGWNRYGQLGDGSSRDSVLPVPVSGLAGVAAVAAGSEFGLALKRDGTVWAWGDNWNCQLGLGTKSPAEPWPHPVRME